MDLLRRRARLWTALGLSAILAAPTAVAQVFAPGPLSRAHSPWRSLSKCDTCHSSAKQIDRDKCLSCHRPVRARLGRGKGFHGQADVRSKPCESCHKEHRGEGASLIPWPKGKEKAFDHRKTGWPLQGAHGKLACDKCHERRRIEASDVLAYLEANPRARTHQGLPTACRACHFDEHRGSEGDKCEKCHDERAWKPVPKFNHDKFWRLEGAHEKVACDQCHPSTRDSRFSEVLFPRPRAATFLKMSPLAHGLCTDCHRDPHNGRFGEDCLACHDMTTWALDKPPRQLGFHDKTDFPLKGRHRFVACKRCHPKDARGKTLLKPIPHDRCGDCHPSAHPDIPAFEMAKADCTRCHDNNGFKPSRFTVADHAKTGFPLRDAHTAAACPACHLKRMGDPIETGKARRARGFLASRVLSPWRMRAEVAPDGCEACHASPHRDQFLRRRCTECHDGRSWRISEKAFDHERTRYTLRGKHRGLPCGACHEKTSDKQGEFVRYRPLDFADCTPCHEDVHYGQFTELTPKRSCKACHATSGFRPARFDHNNPDQCAFPLKGKHGTIGCEQCHPRVTLGGKATVTRYRPTVTGCDGCHEDVHGGAFRGAGAMLAPQTKRPSAQAKVTAKPKDDPWSAPKTWYRQAPERRTDCTACHQETGWKPAAFDHSGTRFPLHGRHVRVACEKCHPQGQKRGVPRKCAGCHDDVHRGSLGTACEECHTEEGFNRTEKVLARHNRTEFPLTGRHAALPCTECHRDSRSREFKQTPTACEACHAKDIPGPGQAAVDHGPLTRSCDRCHTPVGWSLAAFQGHDRCFPIGTVSKHGAVKCRKCHQGAPPPSLGDCTTGTFSCTQCHGCLEAKHRGISGYACEERRCYECHRNP